MKAIKVRFKPVGKRYFFGTAGLNLKDGMEVVVNTIRGLELGVCSGDVFELDAKDLTSELKDVVRIASKYDKETKEFGGCGSSNSHCLSAAKVDRAFASDVIIQVNFTKEEATTLV